MEHDAGIPCYYGNREREHDGLSQRNDDRVQLERDEAVHVEKTHPNQWTSGNRHESDDHHHHDEVVSKIENQPDEQKRDDGK